MNDFFTSYLTGMKMTEEQEWAEYTRSIGYEFDRLLDEDQAVTLVDVCDRTHMMTWVCHTPEAVWGFFRIDATPLKPLDDQTAYSCTRHLRSISMREDWRGSGFWKVAMEIILNAAEKSGILLHGIARPFLLKWPTITNAEEMRWFLENENKFFSYLPSQKEQKRQSKRLLEKYREAGCCGFRYPSGNGLSTPFKRNNFGFAYLSDHTPASLRQTFSPFLTC
jgi:hypothetical protein